MFVFDDVLADPVTYRAMVLARPFTSVSFGDLSFHGIQLAHDQTFPSWIRSRFPALLPTLSFFRQSPFGQIEPNYVHTDRDMGDWTALLYLTPEPEADDGTTFWRHKPTGALASVARDLTERLGEQRAWRDRTQWEAVARVDAKFGRAVLFPAAAFHSRSIPENYGIGDEARLVQVVFGMGTLEEH
jgi:hypothetical protein